MTDPIDPRLQFTNAPARKPYAPQVSQPLQSNPSPYFLPTPNTARSQPPPSAPGPASIDPALEQTSPTGPETSHDEDDHDDGDHQDG